MADLVHWIGKKRLEWSSFASRMLLEARHHSGELRILLALGQDLQAEMVISHVLLVNIEHRQ